MDLATVMATKLTWLNLRNLTWPNITWQYIRNLTWPSLLTMSICYAQTTPGNKFSFSMIYVIGYCYCYWFPYICSWLENRKCNISGFGLEITKTTLPRCLPSSSQIQVLGGIFETHIRLIGMLITALCLNCTTMASLEQNETLVVHFWRF